MASADYSNWQNPLSGLLLPLLGGKVTTNQNAGNTQNISQASNADLTSLKEVYAKQKAGITPEMLSAMFAEGAKKIPGISTAYSNAVGARSDTNSPLAGNILDLQSRLTNDAAVLNNQLLSDSGKTAAQIADLSKTLNTTSTGTNTSTTDVTSTVDPDSLKLLAGTGLGLSGVNALLGGNGVTGGLNDIFKLITGTGKLGAPNATGNLQLPAVDDWSAGWDASGLGDLFGSNYDWTSGLFDTGGSQLGDLLSNTGSGFDYSGLGDIFNSNSFFDIGNSFFGFADGGPVTAAGPEKPTSASASSSGKAPDLSQLNPQQQQQLKMLMQILTVKKMASTPEGRQQLMAAQERSKAAVKSDMIEAQGSAFASPDRRKDYQRSLSRYRANNPNPSTDPVMTSGISGPEAEIMGSATNESRAAQGATDAWAANTEQEWFKTLSPRQQYEFKKIQAARNAKGNATARGAMALMLTGMGAAAGPGLMAKLPTTLFRTAMNAGQQGMADGGQPDAAAGTEDNIPAKLSEGEYVIPADVVRAKGTQFFDKLLEAHHTPADLQRAMGI